MCPIKWQQFHWSTSCHGHSPIASVFKLNYLCRCAPVEKISADTVRGVVWSVCDSSASCPVTSELWSDCAGAAVETGPRRVCCGLPSSHMATHGSIEHGTSESVRYRSLRRSSTRFAAVTVLNIQLRQQSDRTCTFMAHSPYQLANCALSWTLVRPHVVDNTLGITVSQQWLVIGDFSRVCPCHCDVL